MVVALDILRARRPSLTTPMGHAKGTISSTLAGHVEADIAPSFGFIKYGNYWDAENCIRAFWHRGYEAKFARVSHNNLNLYVYNLMLP